MKKNSSAFEYCTDFYEYPLDYFNAAENFDAAVDNALADAQSEGVIFKREDVANMLASYLECALKLDADHLTENQRKIAIELDLL